MIESNAARADAARLSDLSYELTILVGDVAEPQTLVDAGVQRALCRGVLALTDHDQVNLTVATNTRPVTTSSCVCPLGDGCEYAQFAEF